MRKPSMNVTSHYNDNQKRQEFETLILAFKGRLFGTAFRMTKRSLDAEDLVQDTYLKAWRFYYQFQPGTNISAWLFRILTTTFINNYRCRKKEPKRANFEVVCETFPLVERSEFDQRREFASLPDYVEIFDDTIAAALDRLPEQYRTVVLLSDVSELSYKEIAQIIGCPLGTVMSRLSRGRRLLARALGAYAAANGYVSHPTRPEAYN